MQRKQSPRELSNQFGYSSLELPELWSLVLRFGKKGKSVYSISSEVSPLATHALEEQLPTQQFRSQLSSLRIGPSQVHSILATYELLLRTRQERNIKVRYSQPTQLVDMFHSITRKKQEYVYGIYLSPRFTLVHKELLAKGTTDSVIIDIRDVFYFAIKYRVRQFILLHNHPTGDPTPSNEDIEQTKRIATAAKLLSLSLVDHIITGREGYFSFKESTSVL